MNPDNLLSGAPTYVLDSFALLAHLQDERGRGRVLSLLKQAERGECRLLVSMINLGEAAYLVERRRGASQAHKALAFLQALPITFLDVDRQAVFDAAHLKAHYPISFADAFAAAACLAYSAILVTGDPEFRSMEDLLKVAWLER